MSRLEMVVSSFTDVVGLFPVRMVMECAFVLVLGCAFVWVLGCAFVSVLR